MSTLRKRLYTPEEYLALERAAEYRSEYYRGEIFPLHELRRPGSSQHADAVVHHSLIKVNIASELRNALKGKPCRVTLSDARIRVLASGLYTYPDVSVVCGEIQYDDPQRATFLNPTLIVEVLSDSTEAYDRGRKFAHYMQLESMQEYVLISQSEPRIECFSRNAHESWMLTFASGLDQSLLLSSIGVSLSLAEVYDKVEFMPESAAE